MRKFKLGVCMLSMLLALGMLAGCAALSSAEKLTAYDMSGDSIPSVNSVVGDRKVEGVSAGTSNGVAKQEYKYASDSVTQDLIAYIQELLNNQGFLGISDFDVSVIPGSGQIAKASKDSGKIIIMQLDYTSTGYTITISKGEGTLTSN